MQAAETSPTTTPDATAIPDVRRIRLVTGIVLALIVAFLFMPLSYNMIHDGIDYIEHIRDAQALKETGTIGLPIAHVFYQQIVGAIHTFTGNYDAAAFISDIIVNVLTALVLHFMVWRALFTNEHSDSRSPVLVGVLSVLIPLVAMTVWAISLFSPVGLYFGFIGPNPYHSPTLLLLRPLALMLFLLAMRLFNATQPTMRQQVLMGVALVLLTVMGTQSKPNYTVAIVPALWVYAGYYLLRRRRVNWILLVVAMSLPAALLIYNQFFNLSTSRGGVTFEPFFVMSQISYNMVLQFLLSIAFPAAVYVLHWRKAIQHDALNVAWLAFGAACGTLYILSEGGYWQHLNFYWGPMVAMFILFALSIIFFVRENIDLLRTRDTAIYVRVGILLFLLALHLISGIQWYSTQIRPEWGFSL